MIHRNHSRWNAEMHMHMASWLLIGLLTGSASAADSVAVPAAPVQPAVATPAADGKGPTPLNKDGTVLIDAAQQRLILKATVCLRAGPLEMLLCKAQTKEHEAILAIKSDAYVIHAGLLALGAKVGTPVQYDPAFKAPTGQKIKIILNWRDAEGREHSVPAQQWIRYSIYRYFSSPLEKLPEGFTLPKESELRYDDANKELIWFGPMTDEQRDQLVKLSDDVQYVKGIVKFHRESQSREMQADWVFAGSGFWLNERGEKFYQAEDGNVVCVANFGDALLDITIPSTASNDGLQFEPWTDRIPPLNTPVEVHLIPDFTAAPPVPAP
jgi:hypothetical protein